MCTASWSVGHGRLSLFFNRDERKTRSEARPPEIMKSDEVRLIAPVDPDAGGTWLAVNEFGLCVFVLNHYGAEAQNATAMTNPTSRGSLPIRYASYRTRAQAVSNLVVDEMGSYRPFLIVLADLNGADAYVWNGMFLERAALERAFLTTSSYRTCEIETYRETRYESLRLEAGIVQAEQLSALHLDTSHPNSAFNPMMLRDDSRTHSVSRVDVDARSIRFRYQPVVADTRCLGETVSVSLRREGGKGESGSI